MLEHKRILEIEKQIKSDLDTEINLIKNEIYFLIDQNFDLYFLKEFVIHYPPKAVRERAEVLVETLINYFMKDLIEYIKVSDEELQYLFYKENLREKIRNLAINRLIDRLPDRLQIDEEKDFNKFLPILGSVILLSGGIITALIIPENLFIKAIPAVSGIVASVYILQSYKKRVLRLKRKWKRNISKFLENSQEELLNWLMEVENEMIFSINNFLSNINKEMHIRADSTPSVSLQI